MANCFRIVSSPYISSPQLNCTTVPATSNETTQYYTATCFFIEFDTDMQQGPPLLTQLYGLLFFLWNR